MKKDLIFFTNTYPFGSGEEFIENELNYIAPFFETIFLFHKEKDGIQRNIPKNVKLVFVDPPNSIDIKRVLKKNVLLVFYLVLNELFFSRQKTLFVRKWKYNLYHILNCIYYSNQIKDKLNTEILNRSIFYSYWFYDWNFSLSILKHNKQIKENYTRAHRFDIYENNGKENYLPSRKFCLKNTDKVFVISKEGEQYLKKIYPKYIEKFDTFYLGTKDFGINSNIHDDVSINIVSCSRITEVKRIDLIIDTLKYIKTPVLWTHVGDGILMKEIMKKASELPENIKVDFKGRLTQSEIFSFYTSASIDVFINCSSSEGLPVSIMEAISFGIPVIATDVGGTNEIVNSLTGHIIKKDFCLEEVADYIANIKHSHGSVISRRKIKAFWLKNFEYKLNYMKFVRAITGE